MRDLSRAELVVICLMPTGEKNAIRQSEIAELTGYNTREIRLIINSLRSEDYPICSGNYGYYMPESKEDIISTINRMSSQVDTLNQSIIHLRRSVDRYE